MSSIINFFSKDKDKSQTIKLRKIIEKTQKSLVDEASLIAKENDSNASSKVAKSARKKSYEKIKKDLNHLHDLYFLEKNFSEDTFELFIGSELISKLTQFISLQNVELSSIVLPVLMKILFDNKKNLLSLGYSEEILLMNPQCINCIKNLIKAFIETVGLDKTNPLIENNVIPFINVLLNRLIYYPNFYAAISSPNDFSNKQKTFDTHLFELVVHLFSIEFTFENRENKAIVRKGLLKCLNLDKFYTVNISLIEKLLEFMVNNLVSYYQNFLLFDASKYFATHKTDAKKGPSESDVVQITTDDLISYLKFFSMITHCFSVSNLKNYLSNILFNNFFCEYIQKDIVDLSNGCGNGGKLTKLLEFIYYITIYVNNYEIIEMLFFFLFGFNYYNVNMDNDDQKENSDEDDRNMIRDLIGDDLDEEDMKDIFKKDDKKSPHPTDQNNFRLSKLKDEVHKSLRSSNIGTFSSNVSLNIDKSNHNFESIIAFFTLVIESNNSKNKSFLLRILTQIAKNASYVFMTELIIPYYLTSLYTQNQKNFDSLCETLQSAKAKLELLEVLKTIFPKNFSINAGKWINYFEENFEKNYIRNINMLNRINNASIKPNSGNNQNDTILSSRDQSGFLTLNNITMTDYNSVLSTRDYFNTNNNLDIDFIPTENSLNYMLNNYTVNLRIKFYDVIVSAFKNFVNNKYVDNLYLSEFFIGIASLPFSVDKGENGEKLYNIFSNVTFANKKNKSLFALSIVGLFYKIKCDLDEKVRFSYTKEEIDKIISIKMSEMQNAYLQPKGGRTIINIKVGNVAKQNEVVDNIILFREIFQELISALFTKACIEQANFRWSKRVVEFKQTE